VEPGPSPVRCPACGVEAPLDARFCPDCGGPLPLPEPISYERVDREVFGVAPPGLLLGLSIVAFVAGVVLLALGHWVAGSALLVVSAALGVIFAGAARQLPENAAAQGAFKTAGRMRAWTRVAGIATASWGRAGAAVMRLRLDQRRLRRTQRARIHELGDAIFREDDEAAAALKAEAHELGARIEQDERDVKVALASASERVERERSVASATQIIKPS
jgi:hypothetical protein